MNVLSAETFMIGTFDTRRPPPTSAEIVGLSNKVLLALSTGAVPAVPIFQKNTIRKQSGASVLSRRRPITGISRYPNL
jgi:hypothetical protein